MHKLSSFYIRNIICEGREGFESVFAKSANGNYTGRRMIGQSVSVFSQLKVESNIKI